MGGHSSGMELLKVFLLLLLPFSGFTLLSISIFLVSLIITRWLFFWFCLGIWISEYDLSINGVFAIEFNSYKVLFLFGYLNIRIWFEYQMGFLFREFNSYKLLFFFFFSLGIWISECGWVSMVFFVLVGSGSLIVGSLEHIFKKEGLRGMYRGLSPTVIALLPNWAVSLLPYSSSFLSLLVISFLTREFPLKMKISN